MPKRIKTNNLLKRELYRSQRLYILVVIVLLIVWLFSWSFLTRVIGFCNEQAGQFGDSFGALNALFAGLAFFGLIITIRQQGRQYRFERFEENFFQLLQFHNESKDSLIYNPDDTAAISGIRIFQDFENTRNTGQFRCRSSLQEIQQFIEHRFFHGNLYIYFRTLQSLLEYIDRSPIPDKDFYVRIIYSQRLVQEQTALLLYGLTSHGIQLRELVNEFYFLRGYPRNISIPNWIEAEYVKALKDPHTELDR